MGSIESILRGQLEDSRSPERAADTKARVRCSRTPVRGNFDAEWRRWLITQHCFLDSPSDGGRYDLGDPTTWGHQWYSGVRRYRSPVGRTLSASTPVERRQTPRTRRGRWSVRSRTDEQCIRDGGFSRGNLVHPPTRLPRGRNLTLIFLLSSAVSVGVPGTLELGIRQRSLRDVGFRWPFDRRPTVMLVVMCALVGAAPLLFPPLTPVPMFSLLLGLSRQPSRRSSFIEVSFRRNSNGRSASVELGYSPACYSASATSRTTFLGRSGVDW